MQIYEKSVTARMLYESRAQKPHIFVADPAKFRPLATKYTRICGRLCRYVKRIAASIHIERRRAILT